MKKTGIIVIAVVVLLAIFCISSYNSMVSQDEGILQMKLWLLPTRFL